jgi:hypothetical protein
MVYPMQAANYLNQSVRSKFAFVRKVQSIPNCHTKARHRAGYAGKADFVTASHPTGGVTG